MSIHRSLQGARGKSGTLRNILKRHERLQYLMSRGLWKPGESIFGLPKIKKEKIKARKAAAKEKEATAEESAAGTPNAPSTK